MIENWQKKVPVDVEAVQNARKIIILDNIKQVLHNLTQLQRLVTWWNEKHYGHKKLAGNKINFNKN